MRPDRVEAGIAAALEQSTRSLHRQAERTGIIRDLLQGRASRYGYALLLRNLLPAYQQLEQGLESRRHGAAIGAIALQGLFRASAITADLDQLGGREWRETLPLLAAGRHYADRVADATKGDGTLLIAHAYVRYMGDLSGGQILKRLLGRSLKLPPASLTFYDFPAIDDLGAFKAAYRRALDGAASRMTDAGALIEEAAEAFRLNIAVSREVAAAAHGKDFGEITGSNPLRPALIPREKPYGFVSSDSS